MRTLLGGIEMLRSGATCCRRLPLRAAGLHRGVARGRRLRLPRPRPARADRARDGRSRLPRDGRARRGARRTGPDRPARARQAAAWAEWEAFTRRAVERFHRPDEGISICPAPSGPQRCTDEMLAGAAALADELDLAIHIHVLETRMQAVSAQQMYGETLPEHLAALGFLSPRVSFEHGIWLTPGDIELVAAHGVTIVHNPVSNMKLGSGICPVPELLAAGVNVALGTDGMCSNDGNDMYANDQDRGAPAQALGDRLRAVARRRRGVGDGDRERRRRSRRPGRPRSHRDRAAVPTSCCSTSTRSRSRR